MKHFIIFALLFAYPHILCAGETEMALFLSACQNSAENHTLFRSASADFEEHHSQEGGPEEETERRIKHHMPKNSKISPEERRKIQAFLGRAFGKSEKQQRWKMLFSNSVDGGKLHYSSETFDVERNVWSFDSYNIVHGNGRTGGMHVVLLPKTETVVEDIPHIPFMFQHFGRLPDSFLARRLRVTLLQHSDAKRFKFSDEGQQAVEDKMQELGLQFVLAGTAKYDDGQKATVLEIRKGESVVERYWIDENRGFICPLVQCFDDQGKMKRERKSGKFFLHEPSGLWYPEIFEEKNTMSPIIGATTRKFVLDKSTFQLNQPVSDKVFSLDIPEKMSVYDARNGKKRTMKYIAMEPGTLSLSRGGLDLEKMDWLWREGDIPYKKPSAAAQWTRFALMALGIIFIVTALIMQYQRRKEQKA